MKLPPLASVKQGWPRDKVIAQWHKVANDPRNARYPLVLSIAADALKNLHADKEREPGSDDEALAA